MMIQKNNKHCQCADCKAEIVGSMSNKNILDIVNIVLKNGGKISDAREQNEDNIHKIEARKRKITKTHNLYTAMMDDANVPMDQRG